MPSSKLLVDVPSIYKGFPQIAAGLTLKNADAMLDTRGVYFGVSDKERRRRSVELLRQYLPPNVTIVWNAEKHEVSVRNVDAGSDNFLAADGMITQAKNVIITAKSADCHIVSVFDPVTQSIGIIHSGFAGTGLKAPKVLIKSMQKEFDCNVRDLRVSVSAGAGREYFVFEQEIEAYPKSYYLRLPAYSYLHTKKPMAQWRWEKIHSGEEKAVFIPLIRQYIIDQLLELNIPSSQIDTSTVDTIVSVQYNSYRRDASTINYPIQHGLSTGFIGMIT